MLVPANAGLLTRVKNIYAIPSEVV